MVSILEQEQLLPLSLEEAWDFFSDPRNLEEITPDEMGFHIVSGVGESMHEGQIITYRVRILPGVSLGWVTEIKAVDEGKAFVDEQRFGPYRFWHHRHSFEAVEGGVLIKDRVHYLVGWGPFGWLAEKLFVRRKLEYIFSERRRILEERFRMPAGDQSMKPSGGVVGE